MKRCHRHRGGGCVTLAAFGAGLLACSVLPSKLVIVLLGATLVLAGISCAKR